MVDATDKTSGLSAAQAPDMATQGLATNIQPLEDKNLQAQATFDDLVFLDRIQDISSFTENQLPQFLLAKNRARFQRMLSWYKNKWGWLNIAPLSGVNKLFKQQTKELEGIRAHKLDYEMEIEMGTLTPSQRSYKFDELKMCKAHEKLAVSLLSKMQIKIKSGRR